MKTSAALLPLAFALLGCSPARPPQMNLVSARTLERTDEGVLIELIVRGENDNSHEIELRNAQYSISAGGKALFIGKRSAEVSLPRYGRVDLQLLAAVPLDHMPADVDEIALNGWVEYLPPGPFAETLYDNRLQRPKVNLVGTVPLQK